MLSNIKLKLNSQIRLLVKRHRYSVISYFNQLLINRKALYILTYNTMRHYQTCNKNMHLKTIKTI